MKHLKLIFVLSLLFIVVEYCYTQENDTSYSFFIAGHTYGTPGIDNTGLHPQFVDRFSYLQSREEIRFGIFTGDIVSPNPTLEDWIEVDNDIDTLGLPVYFAVGNHDMENRPVFEDRYGETYYSFIYSDDLFIILDPNIDGWNISGDQKLFLEETLNTNKDSVENIFVFFHQLLWWEPDNKYSQIHLNSGAGRDDEINFWSEIEPIFHSIDNQVIMCAGDLGAASWSSNVMYDKYDNITFIASGMGERDGDNLVVINEGEGNNLSYDLICIEGDLNCMGNLEDYQVINSINQNTTLSTTSIYPNPTENFIKFNISGTIQSNYIIYNEIGDYISSGMIINNESIDISSFSSGFYLIKLQYKNECKTLKFCKLY